MKIYFVKDASGWMSNYVFKSLVFAVQSQSWRIADSGHLHDEEWPISIIEVDTKLLYMKPVVDLTEAELRAEVESYERLKKGGSK